MTHFFLYFVALVVGMREESEIHEKLRAIDSELVKLRNERRKLMEEQAGALMAPRVQSIDQMVSKYQSQATLLRWVLGE